jgi:16S rRNA (cytosine967-C5)-methyltransferase
VRQVRLARRVFASADQDPLEFIAQSTSLPRWLLERWQAQQRDPAELLRLGLWFTTPGTMSLRVNLQQTIREKILDMLDAAEIPAQPGAAPEAIRLHGTVNAADLPGFRDGWFSVQDESALAAVELLNPQPGERILDLCAAPGGKACAAAERLAGTGEVIACDVSETRLELIRENASRLRLKNLRTELIPADGGSAPAGPFQAVLADVPCSNTGVLGKRPEARWRLTPASFGELIPLQRRLLELAIDRTAPGGRIVYSTCSIDEQENEQVVRSVLSGRGDVHLEREQSLRPGLPADGGYQALLRRD